MPPDEVRDPVILRAGTGRDRRQTDRGQRRKDGGGVCVVASRCERGERRCSAALDGALERGGGHAVDDDEDELLAHFASVRSPAYRSGARRRRRAAMAGSASASRYPTAGMKA